MRNVDRYWIPEPKFLHSDEVQRAKVALHAYLRRTKEEQAQRRPPFEERLYLHSDVVGALRALFSDKCAYCEQGLVSGTEYVDHFRPRFSASNLKGVESPTAYVWLAYEWFNLLLACRTCAQAKGNLFPVAGQRAHLRATLAEIAAEEPPELLDSTRDDVSTSLSFSTNGECARA